MARKNLSVITKQTGTPLEIAVIPRRLGTPVIVPPNQLTINFLRNLYDVSIVNVVDMQVLQYESGSSYWVNTSPVDAHTYFYTKDQVDALILDVSGAIITGNFVKEGSLGTDFVWNAGLLDVSIGDYATNASVNTALTKYIYAGFTTTSTNYTVNASDSLGIIRCDASLTITLPDSLPTGFQITVLNASNGYVTLNASTLYATDGSTQLRDKYAGASAVHQGSGVWYAFGNLKG